MTSTSRFYLSCLGLIQMIAFGSYYFQFPGLSSASGIEPVTRILPYAESWIYQQLMPFLHIDADSFCELACALGMVLSALIISGQVQHAFLIGFNGAIYSFLAQTGGTFYSFQWDTLLLETTFVTCLTYAPWTKLRPNCRVATITATTSSSQASPELNPIPLRFLLFKLMYMSGVVKLQAHCPTWEQLTALEYHFATQCLPGPLAYHAHQLPPLLLRMGVAATLWIEIPAALLLLVPLAWIRRVGAILQILLQVLIILTGNYNFFNLLTMALCIPVWEKRPESDWKLPKYLESSLLMSFTIISLRSMFSLEIADDNHWNIVLNQESRWLDPKLLVPWVPHATILLVAVSTLYSIRTSNNIFSNVCHGVKCMIVIGIVALPLSQLTRQNDPILEPLVGWINRTYLQRHWLINGYGLFRRMTGVGMAPSQSQGWAGLPPSVVERPEIVLEGIFENDMTFSDGNNNTITESDWQELEIFRWKPGPTQAMPQQVAPHQPRLDWQMWFAALGNIQHNPWLVHLIYKILMGCTPVLDSVGMNTKNASKLVKLRAKLYHYDFTRLDSPWSRTIPGADIISNVTPLALPSQVWTRKYVRMYLPPVESNDLLPFLQSKRYKDFCSDPPNVCYHLKEGKLWCYFAATIRYFNFIWLIPTALLFWGAKALYHDRFKQSLHPTAAIGRIPGKALEEKKTQ